MTDAKTFDCGQTAGTDLIGAMKISQLSSWTGISIIDTMLLPSKGTSAGLLSDKFGRPSRTSSLLTLAFIASTSISHILQTYTKRPGRLPWNALLRRWYLIFSSPLRIEMRNNCTVTQKHQCSSHRLRMLGTAPSRGNACARRFAQGDHRTTKG